MIDPIREALAELVACCTEPAGWSVDMLGDRQLFNEMFARSNDRLQAAIDAARAALAAQPAQATESDWTEVDLWAEIHRLREAVKGPDGYASWQDAATDERIRRVRAEAALAARPAPAYVPLTQRAIELMPDADVWWIWERAATISDKVNELVRLRAAREVVRAVLLAYVEKRDNAVEQLVVERMGGKP
jgi:hypothetical protein